MPHWLDLIFAAGSLAMLVIEVVRWRRGAGRILWVWVYGGFTLVFLAYHALKL